MYLDRGISIKRLFPTFWPKGLSGLLERKGLIVIVGLKCYVIVYLLIIERSEPYSICICC